MSVLPNVDGHSCWGAGVVAVVLPSTNACPRRAGLVDQVLTARGLYLQQGVEGDRTSTTQDHTLVFVEVPSTDFAGRWEKVFPDWSPQNSGSPDEPQ
jgi:hypothetical protein